MEEMTKHTEIKLGDLLAVFKRCWWLMLITLVVVSVLLSTFMNLTHRDEYTSTVTVWAMRNIGGEGAGKNATDVSIANYLINDYKALLASDAVIEAVIEDQKLENTTVKDLRRVIRIGHEEDTRILEISITAGDAATAKKLADAWAGEFCGYINGMMNGEQMISVVGEANLPDTPSNPISTVKIVAIAFVFALIVYALFFLFFIFDDKINGASDVEHYLGLTVLGAIPDKSTISKSRKKYGYGYGYYSNQQPTSGGKRRAK